MTCKEVRDLLPAHLDEELDVMRDAEVVAHLDICADCADAALAHTARRGMIRDKLPRYRAPEELVADISTALGLETPATSSRFSRWHYWLAPLAAALALVGYVGYSLGAHVARRDRLVAELASSHVRALITGHAQDVISTDRHTVKPWFGGKLDFAPAVRDFVSEGYPLAGGRLDRISETNAAVLVYQRRNHMIDLYLWRGGPADGTLESVRAGYNIISWDDADTHYAAVSDLSLDELREFSRLIQNAPL